MPATAAAADVGQAVDDALSAALDADAAVSPPAYDAPPRQAAAADPEAPHGRDGDGTPLAPHGIGKNGRPRIKPAGPGRGKTKDAQPRVTDKPPATAVVAPGGTQASGRDYSEDLAGLGLSVWVGASALKGGRLPLIKVPVPDLRPFAYVWHAELGRGVAAWNNAAQHNAAVRGWVEKLAGEGSWQWVIGVGIWSANLLAGFQELAAKENAGLRAQAAAANDANLQAFLAEQLAAADPVPAAA